MKHAYAMWRWKKGTWFAFELYLLARSSSRGHAMAACTLVQPRS
jgi:hypothetical protein